jgi:hypothetical protein
VAEESLGPGYCCDLNGKITASVTRGRGRVGRTQSGTRRATSVVVKAAPVEARQLGQVIMVKTNFGFIKCCERTEDLFFHFTAVVRLAVCVGLSVCVRVGVWLCAPTRAEQQGPTDATVLSLDCALPRILSLLFP